MSIYKCITCDYNTIRKNNYEKHLITELHKKKLKTDCGINYKCIICNYQTDYKCNYTRHITKCNNENEISEHNMVCATNDEHSDKKKEQEDNMYKCIICDFQSEKSRNYNIHLNSKKHIQNSKNQDNNKNMLNVDVFKNEIISTLMSQFSNILEENSKSVLAEQTKLMIEQHKMITEIANKPTNSIVNNQTNNQTNNQQFNMNVFLNETCKDAMNLSEFLENLHVSMEDMEKTGELGFAKGMSRIIMNNLNSIDVCKRPIHCSDVKRETLYVKNNGVWEKETDERKRTKEIIYKVSCLNEKQLIKWRNLPRNKGYEKSDHKKNDEFTKLVMEINKLRDEEIDKVITTVSKHVAIDKDKIKMSGYLN